VKNANGQLKVGVVDETDLDDFHYSLERKHAIDPSANLSVDAYIESINS